MRNSTREKYNEYLNRIAQLNGIPSASKKFSVEPAVQQTLESKIQESSDFLTKINVVGVPEMKGEKVGIGVSGPVASTTDTTQKDRETSDISALDNRDYECWKVNYDTHIKYAQMDIWAKFPDFQSRLRDAIIQRQALDRIMMGFNGTSRAKDSNRATNPLLQDVNIGWLQNYRLHAPQRVLSEDAPGTGKIVVKDGGEYQNLDALVFDAVNTLLDPWYQEDPELVVICGRKLLADKYFPIVNATQPPTEQIAAHLIISQKRIGNLPAVRVPYFPPDAMLITRLNNLSIYYQDGGRRRTIVDNAKRDRIENYESSNDDYVVEDYGCGCLVENIEVQP